MVFIATEASAGAASSNGLLMQQNREERQLTEYTSGMLIQTISLSAIAAK